MLALLFLSASITRTTAAPATPEYLDLLGLSAVELPGLDESAYRRRADRRDAASDERAGRG